MSAIREDIPVAATSPSEESPNEDGPSEEGRWHSYVGHHIPWYVRLIWIAFWIFAIYYTITFLFPALRVEIVTPP